MSIDPETFEFYDRRIPRQAQRMVIGGDGAAYFTQNNWGKEEQFIGTLGDGVRLFDINRRIRLTDEVQREITQRILEYDAGLDRLYLVRIGETDAEPGLLFVVDPSGDSVVARAPLGLTTTWISLSLPDGLWTETQRVETSRPLVSCAHPVAPSMLSHANPAAQEPALVTAALR